MLIKIIEHISFDQIIRNFFHGFGLVAGLWLMTAPLVGIGLFLISKVSWYVFIGHSSLMLIDFVYKWASRPVYFVKTVPGFFNVQILLGNILLMLIVGYVIRKDFRAPYFQALQRYWRESKRIPIHHIIKIDNIEMKVDNLSTGGCFVIKSTDELDINKEYDISFKSDRLEIACRGIIMRQTDSGYGIMFKEISTRQKRDIHHFLKKRFSLRQQIELQGKWINDGISKDVKLLNVSQGGCFIETDLIEIREKDSGSLMIKIDEKEHYIHGNVTWMNHKGEHNKPNGFGCAFRVNHKKLMKQIVDEYRMVI